MHEKSRMQRIHKYSAYSFETSDWYNKELNIHLETMRD